MGKFGIHSTVYFEIDWGVLDRTACRLLMYIHATYRVHDWFDGDSQEVRTCVFHGIFSIVLVLDLEFGKWSYYVGELENFYAYQ